MCFGLTGERCPEFIVLSLSIPKSAVRLTAVLIAAVVLLWAVAAGVNSGKNEAGAALILTNTSQLAAGLHNFFSDQERYPSAAEFQGDPSLMLNYFSSFPPFSLVFGNCSSSFSYQRPALDNFKLNFCLPVAASGFPSGWSQINETSKF